MAEVWPRCCRGAADVRATCRSRLGRSVLAEVGGAASRLRLCCISGALSSFLAEMGSAASAGCVSPRGASPDSRPTTGARLAARAGGGEEGGGSVARLCDRRRHLLQPVRDLDRHLAEEVAPEVCLRWRGTERARLARPLVLGQKKKCRATSASSTPSSAARERRTTCPGGGRRGQSRLGEEPGRVPLPSRPAAREERNR